MITPMNRSTGYPATACARRREAREEVAAIAAELQSIEDDLACYFDTLGIDYTMTSGAGGSPASGGNHVSGALTSTGTLRIVEFNDDDNSVRSAVADFHSARATASRVAAAAQHRSVGERSWRAANDLPEDAPAVALVRGANTRTAPSTLEQLPHEVRTDTVDSLVAPDADPVVAFGG